MKKRQKNLRLVHFSAKIQLTWTVNKPKSEQWLSGIQHIFKDHLKSSDIGDTSLVFDLEIILIFHPHYHTHSGNTSRPVNLAVVRWLVSYEDKNEYGNDNGNEIEDWP